MVEQEEDTRNLDGRTEGRCAYIFELKGVEGGSGVKSQILNFLCYYQYIGSKRPKTFYRIKKFPQNLGTGVLKLGYVVKYIGNPYILKNYQVFT